eukprot:13056-Eustigmatos_ZCMA.PRE.1
MRAGEVQTVSFTCVIPVGSGSLPVAHGTLQDSHGDDGVAASVRRPAKRVVEVSEVSVQTDDIYSRSTVITQSTQT